MRFGHGVDPFINGDMVWNLGVMLCDGVLQDPYSHLTSSVSGFSYVPNPADVNFLNWLDATQQMNHQRGKVPPKPSVRPWTSGMKARPTSAPDPARKARRAALKERLGITAP